MSARALARAMGIDHSSLFRILRKNKKGLVDPKLSVLEQWAEILRCDITDLFEIVRKKNQEQRNGRKKKNKTRPKSKSKKTRK